MAQSSTKNNESMYISDANKLLDDAFRGSQTAVVNLRASAQFMPPQQAMGLLQRMGHPAQGDVLAAPNARQAWASDRKDLIAGLQKRSRQEPFQHLNGYLGELKKVPTDKQSMSDELSELRKTINGLSKADAQKFLSSFNFGPDPELSPDALRQLQIGLQDRAGVRVFSKGKDGELKDAGDFGSKGKLIPGDPPGNDSHLEKDVYKNAIASPPSMAFGEGKTLFQRSTHRNLSRLQVDTNHIAGKTKVGEFGYRGYGGTANQALIGGVQAQANLIHANYRVKSEPKTRFLAGKEVKTTFEASVDSHIGANGGTRVVVSAGEYPAIQIQSFNFVGARTEVQAVKVKIEVAGHAVGEFRVKGYGSVGGEASATLSFGHLQDSIEGKGITTGFEVGVTAFAGARAGLEAGGDLVGLGGKIKGELWQGVGWVGKIYAKSENGVISFGGEHGAALGVGGSVSWGVSLNPGKVVHAIDEGAKAAYQRLPANMQAAISAAEGAVAHKVASGGKFVANTATAQAQTAGKALHSATTDIRNRAESGGRAVGTLAASAWTAAGNHIQNIKHTAGQFNPDLSRKIRSQQVSRASPTTEVSRPMRQSGRGGVGS
jgi:hypothetical protein